MKPRRITWIAVALLAALLAGCGAAEPTNPQTEPPVSTGAPTETPTEARTEAPTEVPTEAPTEVPTEAPTDPSAEGTVSDYVDAAYAEQIGRYYTALSEQWEAGQYFDNDMSELPYYYYEGEPLDNVGFGYQDLNNDGSMELIIGAILNAEQDPAVFEIWTLVDGEPVMLAQGGSRNR